MFLDIHVLEKKKKNCSLRRFHGYTRFLAVLKHEFLDLRRGNHLYTIFRRAQAKFPIYAIHGLCGTFGNVAPRISENHPVQNLWRNQHKA